jgi:hypothetical protein
MSLNPLAVIESPMTKIPAGLCATRAQVAAVSLSTG